MNKRQARTEAEQLLGARAVIWRKGHTYSVGEQVGDWRETHGTGKSWQEALADARSRKEFLAQMEVRVGDEEEAP